MRKIVAAETMSLDGVVELERDWHLPCFNEEFGREIGAAISHSDALLMGRVNYEKWAAEWPQADPERNPTAGYMNDVRKYVISTTLEESLEWNNSTPISTDAADDREVSSRKQTPRRTEAYDPTRHRRRREMSLRWWCAAEVDEARGREDVSDRCDRPDLRTEK